jgi:hypothetical protein
MGSDYKNLILVTPSSLLARRGKQPTRLFHEFSAVK